MITPASPWIGSTRTATVVSSTASASAWASPNGTTRKPGVNGPKWRRASSSVENEMIVVVRPWKFPEATTIVAWSWGTPLTSYPHLRAAFTAVSTASAPVFIGSTTGSGAASAGAASAARAVANGSSRS
ncbi:hypothetical protein GALL_396280 [mine drainage metagenome]|uniref:Uncharacterized protein n=1 Tax=mine drainage metagenome TaxID=410659 RepID=A0A1J5QMD1_9ZZZZ